MTLMHRSHELHRCRETLESHGGRVKTGPRLSRRGVNTAPRTDSEILNC
jgi:hypothetical protein